MAWKKTIAYSSSDSPVKFVETDSLKNVYIAGRYSIPSGSYYIHGLFIEKRDSLGTIIWKDSIPAEVSLGTFQKDGNYLYLSGAYSSDSVRIGGAIYHKPIDSANTGFIAKYNLNGNIQFVNPNTRIFNFRHTGQCFYSYEYKYLSKCM